MTEPSTTSTGSNAARICRNIRLRYLNKKRIFFLAFVGVVIVMSSEIFKAREHARLVHFGETPDWPLSTTVVLDMLSVGIVTFSLVWVAISFERMEGLLNEHEHVTQELSGQLGKVTASLVQAERNVSFTKDEIRALSSEIAANQKLLQMVDSPEMQNILKTEVELRSGFNSRLSDLKTAWAKLILDEYGNEYLNIGNNRYGFTCWQVAIETYLKEEAGDIANRTIATNLDVYVRLIKDIVDKLLAKTAGTGTRIELFASTNLLPAEFFNWRDYGDGLPPKFGTSPVFMDRYRAAIENWLTHECGLELTRVVIVQSLSEDLLKKYSPKLCPLNLQQYKWLRKQLSYKILCDSSNGMPKKLTVTELREVQEIAESFIDEHAGEEAFGIDEYFRDAIAATLQRKGLSKLPLLEVFGRHWHSKPTEKHALYLNLDTEDKVSNLLQCLPVIPIEGSNGLQSADFMAIRLVGSGEPKVIACITAQLKPNLETMALHLITKRAELANVERFINYVRRPTVSSPLNELAKDH